MSKRADRYIAMLNKADEVYQKDYSTGEYCHEQSFKWGFQEGYEQGEKDTVKRAIEWMEYAKEIGMTFDGTIKYFKAIMEEEV